MKNPAANNITCIDLRSERGQTMAEYGVIIALITLAVVTGLTLMSAAMATMLDRIAGFLA